MVVFYKTTSKSMQQTIVSDFYYKIFRNLLDENANLGPVNKSHVLYPPPQLQIYNILRISLLMQAKLLGLIYYYYDLCITIIFSLI